MPALPENSDNPQMKRARNEAQMMECSACSAWREKWLSTRRYLRAANRGAETNALALKLGAFQIHKLADELQELRINLQLLQAENRELKRALHDVNG